jgi:hypothetical protein
MKKLVLLAFTIALFAIPAFAQEKPEPKKATETDKVAVFDADGLIKRGAALGDSETVSLKEVLAAPADFAGKTVRVDGYVVRSCKMEGCWAELGAEKDAKTTVRVTMKDHQFFIPLKSAGFKVSAEGVFAVTTLSKDKVKHLIEEDGAKFDQVNEDGTVTEVAFVASGVVLSKD